MNRHLKRVPFQIWVQNTFIPTHLPRPVTVHNNNVAAAASIPPRQVEVVVVVGAADVVVVRALLGGREGRAGRSRVAGRSVVGS